MRLTTLLLILATAAPAPGALPASLSETGLWVDSPNRTFAAGVIEYQPRFPLWTDDLGKRRWVQLPPGTSIDGTDPNRWIFPIGTKLWKEFALPGRPVETRTMELTETGWVFAAYVWKGDGSDATLAPIRGQRAVVELAAGVSHDVPGRYDCLSCHTGQSQPVLGLSAIQLATGGVAAGFPDLAELERLGLLRSSPPHLLEPAPAPHNPTESAALGYLHGNCGHCHNREGALASLGLDLRLELDQHGGQRSAVIATTVGHGATVTARSAPSAQRIEAGAPDRSQLLERLSTRDPLAQMPPLGTRLVDQKAVELLTTWIREELAQSQPAQTPRSHPSVAPATEP